MAKKPCKPKPKKAKAEIVEIVPEIVAAPMPTMSEIMVAPMRRPFDPEMGEEIGKLGRNFRVVPISKWNDTPIWAEVTKRANAAFAKTSAKGKVKDEESYVLIQEYPGQDRIAFLFACWARQMGMRKWDWLYVPVIIKLPEALKSHLVLTGRWSVKPVAHP